jgi:hypothetical protein
MSHRSQTNHPHGIGSLFLSTVVLAACFVGERFVRADDADRPSATVLGVDGTRFTLNGRPTFLLGISYYAGLGAKEEFVTKDLDDLQRHGFQWLRVWATCGFYDQEISAVDAQGNPREPGFSRLQSIVAECDRRGMVVDVTLHRDKSGKNGGLPDMAAHQRAVETIVTALQPHRNWYLDLANERDVRDARFVPIEELRVLREQVRQLDPTRLVTASLGGHDLTQEDIEDGLGIIGVDFLTPHLARDPESPSLTESKTRASLVLMQELGRSAPIMYQEPFRRGYERWQPSADDFLLDLRGAKAGGAAGWCFHNGGQRGTEDERPRRSFDLRERRLVDQLDDVEREVLKRAAGE